VIPSGPDSHIEIWKKYLPKKLSVEAVAF
jgi:hypothetical protein